ncbi:thiaminase II [Empedobacter sedimenti]|uniref:thiaminase II n=1 Tax=Empedobacter sedimenti TaxID=3042610 RepID=UPI0024A69CEF|nr:thiaminase II [Empedobacter sedimenti]
MTFTTKAWETITPIYNDILNMPFIKELENGTLPIEKFQFYMLQDAKYLEHFGRVLAAIGAKSVDNQQAIDFFEFGKNALIVERALHESYFQDFGLTQNVKIEIEPVCHHYSHFLKSTVAFDPIEVALAAVLPCFWIYKEVGDEIIKNQSKENNPYQKWIETYSGDEFGEGVKKAKDYINKAAEETTDKIKDQMLEAFVKASELEYQFWKAAYENITWNRK